MQFQVEGWIKLNFFYLNLDPWMVQGSTRSEVTPLNIMALCSYSNYPVPAFVPLSLLSAANKTRKHIDNPGIDSRNPRSITYIREQRTREDPVGQWSKINRDQTKSYNPTIRKYVLNRTAEEKKTGLMSGLVEGMKRKQEQETKSNAWQELEDSGLA